MILMKKKVWVSLVLVAIMAITAACGADPGKSSSGNNSSGKQYSISISQIIEHPSLDATRLGFLAALKDAGIEEGKNFKGRLQ